MSFYSGLPASDFRPILTNAMKKTIILGLILLAGTPAFSQFNSNKISLLSNWFDASVPAEPIYGIKYNGVWGYVDSISGKEFAIIGSTAGTHILEITNPTQPVFCDFIPGRRDSCIWREYKTYKNYLYIISDDQGNNSFQIADLSSLPDSITLIHDSDSLFSRAHTLYIDGTRLYCASVKGGIIGSSTIAVFDITDPENPQIAGRLENDDPSISQVHDMFVRNDTVYASAGYQGLFIYKFIGDIFVPLGSLTSYPEQGYNHSSFLSDDRKTLIMTDEVPQGTSVKKVNVSDLSDITVSYLFQSSDSATPHNPYIKNGLAFIGYYLDGVQVFDFSDSSSASQAGFFDTHPQNKDYSGQAYAGCWGIYTDLPGNKILASDMQNGLFLLDVSGLYSVTGIIPQETNFRIIKVNENTVSINLPEGHGTDLKILNSAGGLVRMVTVGAGISFSEMEITGLNPGLYFLTVSMRNRPVQALKFQIIR